LNYNPGWSVITNLVGRIEKTKDKRQKAKGKRQKAKGIEEYKGAKDCEIHSLIL